MKIAPILGVVGAVLLHALFLLFGGLIFGHEAENKGTTQQVDLLSETEAEAEKKKEEEKKKEQANEEEKEKIEAEQEQVPDAEEIVRNLELTPSNDAPALEAASLAAIEQALSGQGGGGGDFDEALSFASGGRIGGTGRAGSLEEKIESAFSLTEIDQKPRPLFQTLPLFPAEMRGKKIEGIVTLTFVVDAAGKVINLKVLKSTHPAFEKPAIDAVKQWKFEPAVKGGQRVPCKMRAPIRFPPS